MIKNKKPTATPEPVGILNSKSGRLLVDLLPIVLFSAWSFYVLAVRNADYLYAVSEHTLFLYDSSFFHITVVKPGGLLTWAGCFLTTCFHYPWLGTSLLVAIWILTYFVSLKAFRLSAWRSPLALLPLGALLCSVVCVGYWLYYMKYDAYWFVPSMGLLLSVLAIWLFRALSSLNRWAALGWMIAWCIAGYIIAGWWGLFSTAMMAIIGKHKGLGMLTATICIVAVPLIAYHYSTQMRLVDAWTVGFPVFQLDKFISWKAMTPSFVLLALLIAITVLARIETLSRPSADIHTTLIVSAVSLAIIVAGTLLSDFNDSNYHSELRMYRAADEGRWDDVLHEARQAKQSPTREMVMLKNLALTYQGTIGDNMFKYDNLSIPPHTYDSLYVRMAQTNAPLVYMYYARCNFATRWCIENGVEQGFNPDIYKVLTRCALISCESDLASKYINILKKTPFHRQWAEKYEPLLADTTLIDQTPEFANQREYYAHYRSMLDGDEGLVEMYLLQYFSKTMNKDSKLLQETTLVFALQSKDIQLFWPRFFLYAHLHPGTPMPIHYQEAAYLYGNLEHEIDISGMPFDEIKIKQRYNAFNRMSQNLISQGKSIEEVGQIMKPTYGDTFWWFYFFCRGVNSY